MYLSKLKIFSHIHASVLIIGVWPLFTYHVFKPTKVYWSRYTFILLLTDYCIFSFFISIQGRKPFKFLQALPKIGYDLGLNWSTFQHNVRILMYEIFLGFLMLPNFKLLHQIPGPMLDLSSALWPFRVKIMVTNLLTFLKQMLWR